MLRKSDRRNRRDGTRSSSNRARSGCSIAAPATQAAPVASIAPRHPQAAAIAGPRNPASSSPAGTAVCLIENTSGARRGGDTRPSSCELVGVETAAPPPPIIAEAPNPEQPAFGRRRHAAAEQHQRDLAHAQRAVADDKAAAAHLRDQRGRGREAEIDPDPGRHRRPARPGPAAPRSPAVSCRPRRRSAARTSPPARPASATACRVSRCISARFSKRSGTALNDVGERKARAGRPHFRQAAINSSAWSRTGSAAVRASSTSGPGCAGTRTPRRSSPG